jgi:hypothetical protein
LIATLLNSMSPRPSILICPLSLPMLLYFEV